MELRFGHFDSRDDFGSVLENSKSRILPPSSSYLCVYRASFSPNPYLHPLMTPYCIIRAWNEFRENKQDKNSILEKNLIRIIFF